MNRRYMLPEMAKIFSEENHFQLMLDVSITVCEAMADIGQMPKAVYEDIKAKAAYDLDRIDEIEAICHNTVVAFLNSVAESIGPSGDYLYRGISAMDIKDTALSLQIRKASDLLLAKLTHLRALLAEMTKKYKDTLMIGRTHATHAEPITFGWKMALWTKEIDRSIVRLNNARNVMAVGKLSGAVGTFSNIDPRVETFVCRRLGLYPAYVTNQMLQRDRHAEFMTTLAIIGGSLEKFALDLRILQSTDVQEVEENMSAGQTHSAVMPHKRNPVISERICGMSRILRGNAMAALEDIAIWNERDASHNVPEDMLIGDSCCLLDYMLYHFTQTMENLIVYPENMRRNIDETVGLIFSQRVMIRMMDKGASWNTAYEIIHRNATEAWNQHIDFQFLLLEDEEVAKYLAKDELMEIFDLNNFVRNIDFVFHRAGLD
ncbi:MAG: adenylosuccinate lyase [Firmicutes bacterium]|nr:adenylosuccinate lyase [Bacillota bacterium]